MKNLLFLILLLSCAGLWAQTPSGKEIEVGIKEHLGDTIPMHLTFLNEDNDTVTLAQVINKPTVLSFVYFDCPGLCSPLLSGVSDVLGKMDMELGNEYQAVTISFNTKDTPEKARTKKNNFVQNISKDNRGGWIYLTGEEENIKAITRAVGFMYKPQGVDFAHPSAIIVLSPEGKITRYLYGLNFLPFDLKMAVIEAQQGIARPTINKILEYCFAYNPASRGYTLQITRIVGAFILGLAIILLTTLFILGRRKKTKLAK